MDENTKEETQIVPEYTEKDPLKEEINEKNPDEKKKFCSTCCYVLKNVTVEPIMGLFVLSAILGMLTTQNLSLEKACRVNLNFTDEICQSLKLQTVGSQNEYEMETQKLLTKYMSMRTYITATVPCVFAVLAGSWSDKTGKKKVFLIIPVIGQILVCLSNLVNVYFFNELSLGVLVFSEAFLEGFSGGWCLMFFIMFAYISCITSEESRTFRMGLLNFSLTVGFPIGMGISGILLKKFGYNGVYGLSAILHTVNLLYIIFVLKDPVRIPAMEKYDNRGFLYFCKTFFDFSNIKDTVHVVFKKGPNYRRFRMCFMMLVVAILFGPIFGEMSILYMSTRYRFNWDEVKFSIFQSYNFVIHTVGTMFSILVLSKYLQWHDALLGIISTVSKIASSFVYGFASTQEIFYLAPLIEILNGTSLLAMRSIVSKLVAPTELGKVNSIFGLTENLMPLVYVPLYTNVYKATMEVMPGAVFLMGAAMTVPAVIVFSCLLYEHNKSAKKLKQDKQATEINSTEAFHENT